MNYYILDPEGKTVVSNISPEFLLEVKSCNTSSELWDCSICQSQCRRGVVKGVFGSVYICDNSKDIIASSKVFKTKLEIFKDVVSYLEEFRNLIIEKNDKDFKRYIHNVVTNNSRSVIELESFIRDDETRRLKENLLNVLTNRISDNPKMTAITLLNLLRNDRAIKNQFDIYSSSIKKQETSIGEHDVFKVFYIVYKTFFTSLKECNIHVNYINLNEHSQEVLLDYNSFTISLNAIFDNILKYVCPETELIVSFSETREGGLLTLDMISLKVNSDEIEKIFEEGYSGYYSKKEGLCGDGIGLYQAREFLSHCEAQVRFLNDVDPEKRKRYKLKYYENNLIEILLKRVDR